MKYSREQVDDLLKGLTVPSPFRRADVSSGFYERRTGTAVAFIDAAKGRQRVTANVSVRALRTEFGGPFSALIFSVNPIARGSRVVTPQEELVRLDPTHRTVGQVDAVFQKLLLRAQQEADKAVARAYRADVARGATRKFVEELEKLAHRELPQGQPVLPSALPSFVATTGAEGFPAGIQLTIQIDGTDPRKVFDKYSRIQKILAE